MKKLVLILAFIFSFGITFSQHHNHHILGDIAAIPDTGTIVVATYITNPIPYISINGGSTWSSGAYGTTTYPIIGIAVRGNVSAHTGSNGTTSARDEYSTNDITTLQADGRAIATNYNGGVDVSADGQTIVYSSGDNSGKVTYSHNGGSTWSQVTPSSGKPYGISCSGTGDTMLVAGFTSSTMYMSIDGGATWNTKTVAPGSSTAMSANGTYMYLGARLYASEVMYSHNGGSTWTGVSLLTGDGSAFVECSEDGKYVLADTSSDVYLSTDYGVTFNAITALSSYTTAYFSYSSAVSESGKFMVIGDSGVNNQFYYSDDYGSTWSVKSITGNTDILRAIGVTEN